MVHKLLVRLLKRGGLAAARRRRLGRTGYLRGELLEHRVVLSTPPAYVAVDELLEDRQVTRFQHDFIDAVPMIVVGDPNGSPPVTPASRVDPNVTTSPFAGVVSLNMANTLGSFLCSGAMISPRHVVTASHCVDVVGGVEPNNDPTGDGIVDFAPSEVAVVFNHNNPTNNSSGATIQFGVSAVSSHPDWHGFNSTSGPEGPSINDDITIITLSSPAPSGVPAYPIVPSEFTTAQQIVLAGYGTTGDAINGFASGTANFFVKRTGQNFTETFAVDDESPMTTPEIFVFDFDGPSATTDTLGDGLTLGNDMEVSLGGGDSGGPSFQWNDFNSNSSIDPGELSLFGNNTFGSGGGPTTPPAFGSQAGGMIVSGSLPFISNILSLDFGDAPDSNPTFGPGDYQTRHADDGARHIATGPLLGSTRDVETDGAQSAIADGDDAIGDDEDGLVIGNLEVGTGNSITVTSSAAGAKLDYFFDWNNNGSFVDVGESFNSTLNNATENLTVTPPAGTPLGTHFGRFRISSVGGLGSTGLANDGEVEDYQVTVVDTVAPKVVSVIADSSVWTTTFRDFVDGGFSNPSALGYPIPDGPLQLQTLPWINIDRLRVVFSKDVEDSISTSDFQLQAAPGFTAIPPSLPSILNVVYDATNFTATLLLSTVFQAAVVELKITATNVSDAASNNLDGEWVNGVTLGNSGNNNPGGDFSFRIFVLPGDSVDLTGGFGARTVNTTDSQLVRDVQNGFAIPEIGAFGYDPRADLDGNNFINTNDSQHVRDRQAWIIFESGEAVAHGVALAPPIKRNPLTAGRGRNSVLAYDLAIVDLFGDIGKKAGNRRKR